MSLAGVKIFCQIYAKVLFTSSLIKTKFKSFSSTLENVQSKKRLINSSNCLTLCWKFLIDLLICFHGNIFSLFWSQESSWMLFWNGNIFKNVFKPLLLFHIWVTWNVLFTTVMSFSKHSVLEWLFKLRIFINQNCGSLKVIPFEMCFWRFCKQFKLENDLRNLC